MDAKEMVKGLRDQLPWLKSRGYDAVALILEQSADHLESTVADLSRLTAERDTWLSAHDAIYAELKQAKVDMERMEKCLEDVKFNAEREVPHEVLIWKIDQILHGADASVVKCIWSVAPTEIYESGVYATSCGQFGRLTIGGPYCAFCGKIIFKAASKGDTGRGE
jgi:hypothetical protein